VSNWSVRASRNFRLPGSFGALLLRMNNSKGLGSN
jgi:hypothetical protein